MLNSFSSSFRDRGFGGHEFDLSGSRDVIGHVIIWFPRRPFPIGGPWNQASTYIGFRNIHWQICDATVNVILNDLYTKVKVIHFGTNRFLIYFL